MQELTVEKQRRHTKKSDLSTGLPKGVSYVLLLTDEEEHDKTESCIASHLRFLEVVEKLLHRVTREQTKYQERSQELKVQII